MSCASSLLRVRRLPPTRHLLPRLILRPLATAANPSAGPDSFATSNNSHYIQSMYQLWKKDPNSVHPSWNVYFTGMEKKGLRSEDAFTAPPNLSAVDEPTPELLQSMSHGSEVEDHMKVQLLVRAYQVRGHYNAQLDPLSVFSPNLAAHQPPELTLEYYGWNESDLDRKITTGPGILPRFREVGYETLTLREVIDHLQRIYCGHIGIQYLHIPSREECDWLRDRFETPQPYEYNTEEKRMILDRLIWSDSFERFIASKHPNEKRFGLEGCETLIPGMKALIDTSVDIGGVKDVVIGMAHRGRLNVLANVIRKPIEAIFNEFKGTHDPNEEGGGDVKYHLGANYVRPTPSGKRVSLSLAANPSHLEAADPVVLGKAKALQIFEDHGDVSSSMGLLIHGDAAFAGQGVVYETMGFHDLPNYGTGGTVHLIINNQIGFTTDPREGRSTPYPSDIAKAIDAPIFHVNGDDAGAVTYVCRLAAEWRARFHKDVVIDVVCFRRHGHNETDQPSFTQPKMYSAISKHQPTLEFYANSLIKEGTFTQEEIQKNKDFVWGMLEKAHEASKDYEPTSREWLSSSWEGFPSPNELKSQVLEARPTGVELDRLKTIGAVLGSWPEGFNVHRNLSRILKTRGKTIEEGKNIDYSTAEALAFGSLLLEGKHVRVSGQDAERGTFSQRHAVLHDQETGQTYMPLNDLSADQAPCTICNSPLSEFGVLGFEVGYSLVDPNLLVIWEAQFGDFSNGAQIIIDQFIASGERKWLQRTGVVLALPHGYDGQGPDHSSGRMERFLQLVDDSPSPYPDEEKLSRQHQDCNMQIIYPTTPASIFHALRRQINRDFRKPLIVFFSKSLLRHPSARSTLDEMGPGQTFQRYIPEPHPEGLAAPQEIKRHILCSGQIYYQLVQQRDEKKLPVAISRLEQLSPVPYDLITPHIDQYPNAEIMWAQEEPENNGASTYIRPRLETAMNQTQHHAGKAVKYAGRCATSSVATGSKAAHVAEVEKLMTDAFAGIE